MNKQDQQIEFYQYISPDGEVYNFHNKKDRWLMSFTGEGFPPIEFITQQGPNQHGESVIDYRLQKRLIQYVHRIQECDREGYWDGRADISDLLRPNRQLIFTDAKPGHLRYRLPGGKVRQIDVFIDKGPDFAVRQPENYDEYGTTETIRFVAHDPIFYDPTQVCEVWDITPSNAVCLPVCLPTCMGSSAINDDIAINYVGTWFTFPIIRLVGPLNGPVITHKTTGEFIRLNYNIPGGETVTITLDYGNKSVTNNLGTNLQGTVSEQPMSDLATFKILPAPTAPNGVNTINVFATGAVAGQSEVDLAFYTRYYSI